MKIGRFTLLIIFATVISFSTAAMAKTVTLKFNYSMPPKKSIAQSWHWYAAELEKRSNGQLKMQFFPFGGLFKPPATRNNMTAGTADICNLSISTEGPRMPLAMVSSMPTIEFPNTVQGSLDAVKTWETLVKEFPELAAEFKWVKVLAFQYLTVYGVYGKEPIYVPGDIKGKKVRAAAMHAELVKLLGGGPVNIVPPKVYMSMKTGVIDSSIMSISQIYDYKLWEVATNFNDINMGRSLFAIIMNKESWNALPTDMQKLMMDLAPAMVKKGAEVMDAETVKGRKGYLANGGKFLTLTKDQIKQWDAAKMPLQQKWLDNCKKRNLGDTGEKLLKRFKELATSK
jgi:TRAP-type C4-dicarboxylate transport system substrate-binding protein